jgi:hypothetical protein
MIIQFGCCALESKIRRKLESRETIKVFGVDYAIEEISYCSERDIFTIHLKSEIKYDIG